MLSVLCVNHENKEESISLLLALDLKQFFSSVQEGGEFLMVTTKDNGFLGL